MQVRSQQLKNIVNSSECSDLKSSSHNHHYLLQQQQQRPRVSCVEALHLIDAVHAIKPPTAQRITRLAWYHHLSIYLLPLSMCLQSHPRHHPQVLRYDFLIVTQIWHWANSHSQSCGTDEPIKHGLLAFYEQELVIEPEPPKTQVDFEVWPHHHNLIVCSSSRCEFNRFPQIIKHRFYVCV